MWYVIFSIIAFFFLEIFILATFLNRKLSGIMADLWGRNTLFGALYEVLEEDFEGETLEKAEYFAVGAIISLVWIVSTFIACFACFLWPMLFFGIFFGFLIKKKRKN